MSEKIKKKFTVNDKIATFLKRCDDEGNNLLHYVVQTDNLEFAKQLISAGCDVNKKNNDNDPPLTFAIKQNQLEMVKLLINAGADYQNDHFHRKWGPLHNAAFYGCPEIVKLLIEQGVDVNARTKVQEIPLHCACIFEDKNKSDDYCRVIKMLIDAGAEINAIDDQGSTHLIHSIVYKFSAGRELLLTMGANSSLKDHKNLEFLRNIIIQLDLDTLKHLVDLGADINYIDRLGDSCLLSQAAFFSMNDKVEFLLSKGARIDNVNSKGEDPLCIAIKLWPDNYINFERIIDDHDEDIESGENRKLYLDNVRCLDILIKHGANINHVTKQGLTPLYIVLKRYRCHHSNFARILLKNGAKFDFEHPLVREVMKNTNGTKFPHLLLRHAAMFQAQNRQDGPTNFDLNKLNKESQKYYAQCRDELESMKTTKIDDTNVTFFNILVNTNIGPYTRNENVKSAFEETDISKLFSIYSDLLIDRFSEEIEFQKLVEKATSSLCCILNWDRNSTNLLLNNILCYLNEKDLANLALI